MNCENFENVVNDLARNQMMEASVREHATLHSTKCDGCAERLRNEQLLTADLRELAAEIKLAYSDGVAARIEDRVLSEFRNHNSAVNVARRVNRSYRAYAGIAAVLLVSFSFVALRLFNSTTVTDPVQKSVVVQFPETNDPPRTQPLNETIAETTVPRRPRMPKRSVAGIGDRRVTTANQDSLTANNRENEITTEFFPVGYASTLSVQDGGQLIRVEMPRSAMTRFGIPVNMDRYDERVKADLLVGNDGLARAVRFVQ